MTVTEPTKSSHSLHYIPAKIEKPCTTTEFQNEFINETPQGKYITTYLRGKQLKGMPVNTINLQPCLVEKTDIKDDTDTTTILINNSSILKLNNIINYEREGNEERLKKEHERFNEFMDITNLIHKH